MPGPENLRESHAIAFPVWECNKAMENDPFVDDLPIKRGHFDTGTSKKTKHQRTLRYVSEFVVENLTFIVCRSCFWVLVTVLPQDFNIVPGCKYGDRCYPRLNPVSRVSTRKALMSPGSNNRRSRQGIRLQPNMA